MQERHQVLPSRPEEQGQRHGGRARDRGEARHLRQVRLRLTLQRQRLTVK